MIVGIGAVTVIIHERLVEVHEPITTVRLDTPAGLVIATVEVEGGKARNVTLTNVPSFSVGLDRTVEVPGFGEIRYDMAFGGNFYAIGTVELTVPNHLPEQYGIKTSLFADVGTLGVLDDRYKLTSTGTVDTTIADELSLRASAGVSIHWKSPTGPIRFDISKVLSKEDYDKTESFRFSTSTQF